jgi:hypothetical protein
MNCLMIRICLPMAACWRPPFPGWAVDRWSESPRFRWSSATDANAHEILSAAGYSQQEIIELRSAGVLGAAASVPA